MEPFPVPPAVPQMQNQVRGGLLHGLLHGTDGAMGIREYQNFHRHFLSGEVFWFSIEDGGRFCKFFAWIPGALSRMRKKLKKGLDRAERLCYILPVVS